jgi:agmatine deiminase
LSGDADVVERLALALCLSSDGRGHTPIAHTTLAASLSTPPALPTQKKTQYAEARAALPDNVRVVEMTHDDSWLRDTAPTFVHARVRAPGCCPAPPSAGNGKTAAAAAAASATHHPILMATDWRFNGWGDLYGTYERDKDVARHIASNLAVPCVSVDMVLEGGSIHVDGQG